MIRHVISLIWIFLVLFSASGSYASGACPSNAPTGTCAYTDPDDFVFGRDQNGVPTTKPYLADIKYLDAAITDLNDGNKYLQIAIGLDAQQPNFEAQPRISIFIDADADSATGCGLPGCPRSAEYRIDAELFPGSYLDPTKSVPTKVLQLSKALNDPEKLLWSGTLNAPSANGLDHFGIQIPVSLLNNATNVNLSALSYLPKASGVNPFLRPDLRNKQGDRAPDFGEFNTTSRSVVNNEPVSEVVTLDDPIGDNVTQPWGALAGPDLRQVLFQTVGDQFCMKLVFQEDVMQSLWDPNVGFIITFDSDRRLETGQIFMGEEVPSWGGDVGISWLAGSVGDLTFNFVYGSNVTSQSVALGGPTGNGYYAVNDARWEIIGNTVNIQLTKSLLDIFKTIDLTPGSPIGNTYLERIATGDNVRVSVNMLVQNSPLLNEFTDWAPSRHWVFDTATGQSIPPLVFTPSKMVQLTDSAEPFNAGLDIKSIDYQVEPDVLIFRATIDNWLPDETQLLYNIFLDADSDPNTGLKMIDGQLGAEYTLEVKPFDDFMRRGYNLQFVTQATENTKSASSHDAWLKLTPPLELGTPGTITITIPRSEIPLVKDKANVLFLTGKWTRVAGQPPIINVLDVLPNDGVEELMLSSTLTSITSVTPASGATGVPVSSKVTATFSEAMDSSTISASSFTLKNGSISVAGTVSYDSATRTATFTPSATLSGGTTYTATITTGVRDTAGNPLAAPYSWSFSTQPTQQTLAVTVSGSGTGTVTSNPPGISCLTGTCAASFPADSTVTLMATPSSNSLFDGWSGSCTNKTGDCVLKMDTARNVTANFVVMPPMPPVRTENPITYFWSLAEAVSSVPTGGTIQAQATKLTENVALRRAVSVMLKGGYNGSYSSVAGRTILNGKLVISQGRLTVRNLAIR